MNFSTHTFHNLSKVKPKVKLILFFCLRFFQKLNLAPPKKHLKKKTVASQTAKINKLRSQEEKKCKRYK
jgi:hypothetical protein